MFTYGGHFLLKDHPGQDQERCTALPALHSTAALYGTVAEACTGTGTKSQQQCVQRYCCLLTRKIGLATATLLR